jgi:hypothetical protein
MKITNINFFREKENHLVPDFRIPYKDSNEKYFDYFHSCLSDIKITSNVSQNVFINFETSRNTLLYSYYCYRMSAPAALYLLSTLEMALEERAKKSGKEFKAHQGLNEKFKYAFTQKWLDIKKLAPIQAQKNVKDWVYYTYNDFIGYYVFLRNELAHGSFILDTPMITCDLFDQIAHIINMLYEE